MTSRYKESWMNVPRCRSQGSWARSEIEIMSVLRSQVQEQMVVERSVSKSASQSALDVEPSVEVKKT